MSDWVLREYTFEHMTAEDFQFVVDTSFQGVVDTTRVRRSRLCLRFRRDRPGINRSPGDG